MFEIYIFLFILPMLNRNWRNLWRDRFLSRHLIVRFIEAHCLLYPIQAVFPVVWVDEGATIDGENMDKLKAQLVIYKKKYFIDTGNPKWLRKLDAFNINFYEKWYYIKSFKTWTNLFIKTHIRSKEYILKLIDGWLPNNNKSMFFFSIKDILGKPVGFLMSLSFLVTEARLSSAV